MLFEDPYKNIHGHTVPTPGESTAIDPLGRPTAAQKQAKRQKTQNNAAAIFVIVFLFVLPVFAVVFFILHDEYHNSNSRTDDDDIADQRIVKILDNLKDSYTLDEIANGFSFDSYNIKFTPTSEFVPLFVQHNDTFKLREVKHPSNQIFIHAEWQYGGSTLDKYKDACLEDTANQCTLINNGINLDQSKYLLARRRDFTYNNGEYYIYTLYYTLTSNLITISYEPVSANYQTEQESINSLNSIINTLSLNHDTPDVSLMAEYLDLPFNKKIPDSDDIVIIDFASRYVTFTTKRSRATQEQYRFTVYYKSCSEMEEDADYVKDGFSIYPTTNRQHKTFTITEPSRPYCFEIEAKLGQTEITSVEDFLEAYDTLSDRS